MNGSEITKTAVGAYLHWSGVKFSFFDHVTQGAIVGVYTFVIAAQR